MNPIYSFTNKKITWLPTLECNFKCHFCSYKKYDVDRSYYFPDKYNKIVNFINTIAPDYDNKLVLFGGEPTIHINYFDILDSLTVDKIDTLTNLSMNTDFYSKVLKYKNNSFSATYHAEEMEWTKFYDNVIYLINGGISIEVSLVFENTKIKDIENKYYPLYKKLRKTIDNLTIRVITANFNDIIDYKIAVLFNNDVENETCNIKHLSKNSINRCDSFKHRICINYNGDVYPCNSNREYPLFNIITDDNPILKYNTFKNMVLPCFSEICIE